MESKQIKTRDCLVCKKETDFDNQICKHCNKGVFVFDFTDTNAKRIDYNRFKIVFGQICGWHDIPTIPGLPPPKPPREWRCIQREPLKLTLE